MNGLVKTALILSLILNIFYFSQNETTQLSFINPSNPELLFPIDEFNNDTSVISEKESQQLEKQLKEESIAEVSNDLELNDFSSDEYFDGAESRMPATEEIFAADEPVSEIKDIGFDLKDALIKEGQFSEDEYAFYQDLDRQRSLEISEYISQISSNADSFSLDETENDEVVAINQKYKDILLERVGEDSFKKYEDLVNQLNEQSVTQGELGEEFYLLDF